jgi:hypothetical protein
MSVTITNWWYRPNPAGGPRRLKSHMVFLRFVWNQWQAIPHGKIHYKPIDGRDGTGTPTVSIACIILEENYDSWITRERTKTDFGNWIWRSETGMIVNCIQSGEQNGIWSRGKKTLMIHCEGKGDNSRLQCGMLDSWHSISQCHKRNGETMTSREVLTNTTRMREKKSSYFQRRLDIAVAFWTLTLLSSKQLIIQGLVD